LLHVVARNQENTISKYLVCHELHEDGESHIHAFIKFAKKLDTKNPYLWDFLWEETGESFHPNIQGCRSENAVIKYCKKEGDYISDFYQHCSAWADAIKANSIEEAINVLSKEEPKAVQCNFNNILAYHRHVRMEQSKPKRGRFSYFPNILPEMGAWVHEHLDHHTDRPPCLILLGASRLGKTEWAQSLGTHMYFRGHLNWDDWNPQCRLLILDDFSWNAIPYKKCLLTCMRKEATVNPKYGKMKTIMMDKRVIIIGNEETFFTNADTVDGHPQDPYWTQNAIMVHVTNRLY